MENEFYNENDAYIIVPSDEYDVAILVGTNPLNFDDDNVDVEIRFKNGSLYTATFFTTQNIESIFRKNRETGECQSGLYFYCKDMIIVEKLTIENIVSTVKSLLKEDLFYSIFDSQNLD